MHSIVNITINNLQDQADTLVSNAGSFSPSYILEEESREARESSPAQR
jgi:hypothetical protein